ncbi:MAG: membrane protein insertase YidC [Herpetosiphon sp.]|nr:membrane protein insertase YidC [Herpetosiphon sp.]
MFEAIGNLLLPILKWLFGLFGNLGWAIIVFTILVRLAMLPLTLKQLRSQKKMMVLQPKLRELQRKYGKDREKLTAETMKLYKDHGSSPASGCLPLLISLPILIGVWQAVYNFPASAVQNASQVAFAWIPRLIPEVNQAGAIINNGRDPYFILPILAVVLQLITSMMTMSRTPDPQQVMTNRIMLIMPLMFSWFYFTIPAGATLYSVTGSLIQMVQQYFTTGLGILPKYLPFLPEKTGFLNHPTPQPEVIDGEAPVVEETSPRRDFWTALQKLAEPVPANDATETAINDVKTSINRAKKSR